MSKLLAVALLLSSASVRSARVDHAGEVCRKKRPIKAVYVADLGLLLEGILMILTATGGASDDKNTKDEAPPPQEEPLPGE